MGLDTSYNNLLWSSPYNHNINVQDDNSSYKYNYNNSKYRKQQQLILSKKNDKLFTSLQGYMGKTRDECM